MTRTPAVLHGCEHAASELRIDVDVDRLAAGAQAELVLARPKGAATDHLPATVHTDGRREGAGARRR